MIYIDPSELRETSNLLRYVSDMVYKSLPSLEALTGADVMISPQSMPFPRGDKLVLSHIKGGAKLLQLKFGHDLAASVTDGRMDHALYRMQDTGASPWQCCLLFIGLFGYDDTKGMATINGQLTYGDYPLEWSRIDQAFGLWIDQGGSLEFPLASGQQIPERFGNVQRRLDKYLEKPVKYLYPESPMMFREVESSNPVLKKWGVGRKLERVEDLRQLIKAIPKARIGHDRATAIFEWMKVNGFKQHFGGFLEAIQSGRLTEIHGIGPKIVNDIKWGLYATLEERQRNNEK